MVKFILRSQVWPKNWLIEFNTGLIYVGNENLCFVSSYNKMIINRQKITEKTHTSCFKIIIRLGDKNWLI